MSNHTSPARSARYYVIRERVRVATATLIFLGMVALPALVR